MGPVSPCGPVAPVAPAGPVAPAAPAGPASTSSISSVAACAVWSFSLLSNVAIAVPAVSAIPLFVAGLPIQPCTSDVTSTARNAPAWLTEKSPAALPTGLHTPAIPRATPSPESSPPAAVTGRTATAWYTRRPHSDWRLPRYSPPAARCSHGRRPPGPPPRPTQEPPPKHKLPAPAKVSTNAVSTNAEYHTPCTDPSSRHELKSGWPWTCRSDPYP